MNEKMVKEFQRIFKNLPEYQSFAPGRVNLIGEHTDYTGGYVFPLALDIGTYALARKRRDGKFRFFSMNEPESGIIEVDKDWSYRIEDGWGNYPKGLVQTLDKKGFKRDRGLDILFWGDIPRGAGLSSSASIELATGVMIDKIYDFRIPRVELVTYCRESENVYVGVNCGIMDQFIIGMGEKNHGLLLNTGNLSYEQVPLPLKDHSILIINSMVRRRLSDSGYNRCIEDAKAGEKILQEQGIKSLGELTPRDRPLVERLIKHPGIYRRVKHIITENHRTLEGVELLIKDDVVGFGALMLQSHESLRRDFEVSIPQLDTLVEESMNLGAVGARMTGAGFGGCIVTIVPKGNVAIFKREIAEKYRKAYDLDPEIYIVNSSSGAVADRITREVDSQ
ncbi:galactokinase [Isachenkonia alkalipeptolytica]|uniref:Galactokinase n=1 Tax=Isachenkonia alkalipeptolytica TaxID=2565777 RepID=A0AA44BCM4_9CLOT|nr:galactokinase [Isachenkonia alkalipeptolytica]NBG87132.1 galactokinase [Isachenkonia alkalipeptolytica]